MKKKRPTLKQKTFVKEYLSDLNATQAAIRAGYKAKRADQAGYELLRKPEIQEYLQEQKDKRAVRLDISADRVLQERARLAFFNIKKLYHEDGTLKQLHELDDDLSAAIHGVKIGGKIVKDASDEERLETFIKSVRMMNKDKSLEALEKHLGLYQKDNEQQGNADLKTKQEFMAALLESISRSDRGLPKE